MCTHWISTSIYDIKWISSWANVKGNCMIIFKTEKALMSTSWGLWLFHLPFEYKHPAKYLLCNINFKIARHVFILNDLYSGGRNPGKIKNNSTFVAMTSHKHKQKVPQKFYKRKQNSTINLYTSYCTNWSAVVVLLHLTYQVFLCDRFLGIVCCVYFQIQAHELIHLIS
jgi:hypothetical protein